MAYDAAKAHEYYINYIKKNKKKGRKKSTKKTTTKKTNLVGLSNSGLNDAGKMQWAMAKERLTTDMNAALSKAKTPEEKNKIRAEYQNKALQELNNIKGNAAYAKAKSTKTSSAKSSGTKASSSKSSSSKSKKSSTSSKSTGSASTPAEDTENTE